jgi:hypothetical protein
LYVLKAPNAEMSEPPIKIPYIVSIVSGFVKEKTKLKKTPRDFHIQ